VPSRRGQAPIAKIIPHKIRNNRKKMSEALLLVSYGSPEVEEDVVPFLSRLLGQRGMSDAYIKKAADKYYQFARRTGAFSPLNSQCRELAELLRAEFERLGLAQRIYWGNLYWVPFLDDAIESMTRDGITEASCFVTSAFDSTAGNRRYSAAIESARQKIGNNAPRIVRLPLPFDNKLFIEAQAELLQNAIKKITTQQQTTDNQIKNNQKTETKNEILILFTAHSIPVADPAKENYIEQLNFTCNAAMNYCRESCPNNIELKWELLFQSQGINNNKNKNTISIDWLKPNIKDRFTEIIHQTNKNHNPKTTQIIISPIGFFCENLETVNDLDLELGDICTNSSVKFIRVKTVGTTPKICKMITQSVVNYAR
jgi:ferrochelatase